MKRIFLAAMLASAVVSMAWAAGPGGVKTVYLLPMSNGLDQYLAVQLTTNAVLQVVTDPQKADAVFTDHLGESFEQSLAELNADRNGKSKSGQDDSPRTFARSGMTGQRGHGTAFLVDRKSHDVLWSIYERPKDNTPDGLKRVAGRIAAQLARTISGK
jgi:hypothetical protein